MLSIPFMQSFELALKDFDVFVFGPGEAAGALHGVSVGGTEFGALDHVDQAVDEVAGFVVHFLSLRCFWRVKNPPDGAFFMPHIRLLILYEAG